MQLDKQAEPADGARIIPIKVTTWQMDACKFPTAKIGKHNNNKNK